MSREEKDNEGLKWWEIVCIIIGAILMIALIVEVTVNGINNQDTLRNLCNSRQGIFVSSNLYYCDILQDGVYVRYIATCSNDNCRLVSQGVSER